MEIKAIQHKTKQKIPQKQALLGFFFVDFFLLKIYFEKMSFESYTLAKKNLKARGKNTMDITFFYINLHDLLWLIHHENDISDISIWKWCHSNHKKPMIMKDGVPWLVMIDTS